MTKTLFYYFLFFFAINSSAQTWVNSNPVWYYHYEKSDLASEYGEFKITDIGDSIIEGQNCQMLQQEKSIWVNSGDIGYYLGNEVVDTNYVRVDGDTVFYYQNGQFRVLYNFDSNVGDSWLVYVADISANSNDSTHVIVTEKGFLTILGTDYRYFKLETIGFPNYRLSGTFVERFGKYSAPFTVDFSLGSLFPYNYVQPEFVWTDFFQTCFYDESLSYQAFSWCYLDTTYSGITESKSDLINIFPNPFTDYIHLQGNEKISDIELLDWQGKCLHFFKSYEDVNHFNFKGLESGMYLLKLVYSNQITTKSIIKQ